MRRKGFTLIEVIVVVAIIGIITTFMFPKLLSMDENTKKNQIERHIEIVEKNLRQYYAIHAKYPDTLEDLKEDGFGFIVQDYYTYEYTVESDKKNYTFNITMK